MLNLPLPTGFRGLNPDKPVTKYERQLPHWRQEGATYFVTFRLMDSLPQSKLRELKGLRDEWERRNPPPRSEKVLEQFARETFERVERWLDQGMGSCVLRSPANSAYVTQAMHHFDGSRYELDAYVVMPNHVHSILRPTQSGVHRLEDIVGSWKQFSSRRINAGTGNKDGTWQEESFDRIIRDDEHLYRVIQYIGRNPENAGLDGDAYRLWIRPEWEELGWMFEPRIRP